MDKLYRRDSVRKKLRAEQLGKCAYCERLIGENPSHVDHFRPFTSVRDGQGRLYPGYYWLGYIWSNLFLSCSGCNGRKSDLFPLSDPTARVRNHHGDLADEDPLFIDPASEDPRDHIRFHLHSPVIVNNSPKGKATIEVLGFEKRLVLESERLERLNQLNVLKKVVELHHGESENADFAEECLETLRKAVKPTASFSSMAKDFLDEFLARFESA